LKYSIFQSKLFISFIYNSYNFEECCTYLNIYFLFSYYLFPLDQDRKYVCLSLHKAIGATCVGDISAVSFWSVGMIKETELHRKNHWPVVSHWPTWSHNFGSSTPPYERDSNSYPEWWQALIAQHICCHLFLRNSNETMIIVKCIWMDMRIDAYISTSKNCCNKLFLCARIVEHSWRWHVSLIYNYLCNQCLSPLKIWVRISFIGRCTRSKIMCSSWSVTSDRSVFDNPGT
jgi:hypothetical protein